MIIFLYGDDSFRSGRKLKEIKDKFLISDPAGSGLSVFDYEEKKTQDNFKSTLETPNLLASKRLIISKNLIINGNIDDQKSILRHLKEKMKQLEKSTDTVLAFWEGGVPKKNNAFFKFLESKSTGAKKQNFEKLTGEKLNQWILKKIKSINPKAGISNSALEKLIAFTGGNMQAIDSETEKLVIFCGEKIIQDNDVEKMVNSNLNANIFNTIDALGGNNKKEAARLIHEHLKQGEDPFYLFSMFVYQFRNLLKIADAKLRGISGEYEIAKATGLHPFVVKKSLYQTRNLTFSKLKDIYSKLSQLDTKIKTGKIDIKLALDKFIVEL